MLKRQTVSVSVAARRGLASGLRRSAAGSGAPGRDGSRSPREPPAISRSARPARIRSGIGTELALSGSTGETAVVSVGGSSEPSEGSAPVVSVSVLSVPVVSVGGTAPGVGSVSRGRCGLAALAVLERALDVVLRARVVAHVARQDLDRVVVAVERHRSRRRGRCRTSRRSPGGRTTRRRRPATRPRASCRNAATTTSTRSAPRTGSWVAAGIKVVSFPGVLPANCGEWCRVSRTALRSRVSGW